MNTLWKLISLGALVTSLAALLMMAAFKRSFPVAVRFEVQRQIAEREETLLSRSRATINRMRADTGQPQKEIRTTEDAVDALLSIFDVLGEVSTPLKK